MRKLILLLVFLTPSLLFGRGLARLDNNLFFSYGIDYKDGVEIKHKFGRNEDIDTAANEGIAFHGGSIVMDVDNANCFIASTDAGDGQDIIIKGLDLSYEEQSETVTLNGQTPVQISGDWETIFNAANVGSTDLAGTVAIMDANNFASGASGSASDTLLAFDGDDNQALSTQYMVSVNKTAYITGVYAAISKDTIASATVTLKIKLFGEVWRTRRQITVSATGSSLSVSPALLAIRVPAKSQIKMFVPYCSDANSIVTGGYDMIIIDDD